MEDNINNLLDYMHEKKAKRYPITETYLRESNGEWKNLYFSILCLFIDDITEQQRFYFERILEGVGSKKDIFYYLKISDVETESKINSFINRIDGKDNKNDKKFIRDQNISQKNTSDRIDVQKYYFLIDAFILMYFSENEEEYFDFYATWIQLLGLSLGEVDHILKIAKMIIIQDAEELKRELNSILPKYEKLYMIKDTLYKDYICN